MSARRGLYERRVGPLRRALGIPYSWPETIAWPLRCTFPAPPPRHAFAALPPERAAPGCGRPALRIAFLGDLMPTPIHLALDVDADLKAVLAGADLVVANCETPLADTSVVHGTRFQLDASVLARRIEALGISPERLLLSLANNHAEDRGVEGLAATAARIEALGARVVGFRHDEADAPVILAGDVLRVGLAAWTHWRNRPAPAGTRRPWAADDVERVDWHALRRSLRLDGLIGFPHWDLEFRHAPHAATRQFAHALVGRGFDVLVGHHPHVIQGSEKVGAGLVFYSCGNAISNNALARRWTCRLGLILTLDLHPGEPLCLGYRVTPYLDHRSSKAMRWRPLAKAPKQGGLAEARFNAVFPPKPRCPIAA